MAYAEIAKKLLVIVTGKLAPLIGNDDGGRSKLVHGILYGDQDGARIQCAGQLPAHDLPAVPVDDDSKIHMAPVELDVSDIHRPHRIHGTD